MERIWFVIELANLVTGFCSMADKAVTTQAVMCVTQTFYLLSVYDMYLTEPLLWFCCLLTVVFP